jgi:hypothetical protein
MNVLRRIGAVFAGLFVIFAVTTATDIVFHLAGVFPPTGAPTTDGPLVLATAYRIVYGVAGSWVTARVAPDRPMRHALVLGLVGVAISTAGAIVMHGRGPLWYSLAVIAMALPCGWAGGRLRELQIATPARRDLSVS